ncbi:class I SAM-dependent methyltransferase [Rarobacter faecitabidus]|uniref:Methyltransferase family protein n=1 Tax=Rarobacter faecitabidus TaxID=13243 RepID=A0A542Z8K7_RARFA|nr:class I SAM-dependent methyltransferase [Rarobacter faecitabidus]TQL56520.1 hypothetical protein FB461_2406 [Rarobacter faecitabidus]
MPLPPILDTACGPRMMWFDPLDDRTVFADIRSESIELCDGRTAVISPDLLIDFRELPFTDDAFYHVVFDPPHFNRLGKNSYTAQKYGSLAPSWKDDLRAGFAECFRVLKPHGTLIFKWNEHQIPIGDVLALTDQKPLYGHKSGKASKTHWIAFMKPGREVRVD